uniref:Ankyrin repeat and KH domain-containing protein mask n=2 Tax=Talaromyces marneffei PM1 TaxID=1077442 RepID=A0A093VRU7_TALMA
MEAPIHEDNASYRSLSHRDYTIAWISALPTEMAVAEAMLDERYPDLQTPPNDDNTYIFGRMHSHNIIIACLPAGVYGTTSAATVASQIRTTFPSLRFGLMVGIGGGVASEDADIRLGDVVVSKPTGTFGGVIQYDYGKALHDGCFERIGMLNKPPLVLLTAVSTLQAAHMLRPSRIPELISEMVMKYPIMKDKFTYPSDAQDMLFDPKSDHADSGNTCANCDTSRQVKRVTRHSHDPAIHYGLIASGNQVMKDGQLRDSLAQKLGVLCFEMEAAGLMENFPCLVIRGICDYADSHKNKQWQPYAAATAAAYAKELLSIIHVKQLVDTPTAWMTDSFYYRGEVSAGAKFARSGPIQRRHAQDYERLFEKISNYDHEKVHRRLSHKRLTGTTQWFLDHPDFEAWFTEKSISYLWCSGKIGSGKTMIATAVVDAAKYRNSELPTATVFFYCQNEQDESLQAPAILSSFIKQLCEFMRRTSNSFPEGALQELQKFFGNDRIVPDFEDLKDLFMHIFYQVPNTIYVVDGIDMLDRNNSKRLLKLIQSIFCGRKSLEGSRILLLSRDHIEGYINISTFMPGIRQISTSTNILADIKHFIDMSIVDKTMDRKLTDDHLLLEELKSTLLAESTGMFLWVYLQLEIIWSTCFTDAEIRLALSQLPKDLEETYQYCIQRINLQDNRTVKVLKWVRFAARPLHIEELKEAVAFDILDSAWNPERIPQQDFIIGCCANLVILDPMDHCVRFAHSSVKQYLTKHRGEFLPNYPISEDHGELECGEFCIAYLSFSDFSMSVEKYGHQQISAVVPKPAFLVGEAVGPTLSRLFRIPKQNKGTITLSFPSIRTASTPTRSQFMFLNYAIMYWALQTRHIKQSSPVWDKFEQLATHPNETWKFHPWVMTGPSIHSRLHGLLGWAVKERHEPLLSIALDSGKYIRQVCNLPLVEERLPPLHLASKLGYYDIVKSLLGICHVNSLDVEDCTALHHASSRGHIDIVSLILKTKGAIVDPFSKSGVTPLWFASANGHDNVVSLLIENKADIETTDNQHDQTPLLQAALKGHDSVVSILIKNKANLEARNNPHDQTPLLNAAEKGHDNVVSLLIKNQANIEATDTLIGQTPLLKAIENGHDNIVSLLIKNKANIEARDNLHDQTPLLQAAEKGHDNIVSLLLKNKANIEACNPRGQTPLGQAAENGHYSTVELLVRNGANIEAKTGLYSQTPLCQATEKGHYSVVEFLVRNGANIEERDIQYGQTPLCQAAEKGHYSVVEFLTRNGAKIEARDIRRGQTPLCKAAENDHYSVVEFLVRNGASIEARDDLYGQTPLCQAAKKGHYSVVEFLTRNGANIEAIDTRRGQTPLCQAAENGHFSVVEFLVRNGANIEARDDLYGQTPLCQAAENGHFSVVEFLVRNGANIEARDDLYGQTPLYQAANKGHYSIVEFLIRNGSRMDQGKLTV